MASVWPRVIAGKWLKCPSQMCSKLSHRGLAPRFIFSQPLARDCGLVAYCLPLAIATHPDAGVAVGSVEFFPQIAAADIGGHVAKLEDGPWPAFPADAMSIVLVTATQCEGMILLFEKMFESRLFFVDKLIGMGARIVLCDPHRALVAGPSRLRGSTMESPDIRAGMAMLLAALCAEGESTINNVGQIERGYERIDERLSELGAKIERVADRRSK